MKTIEFAGSSVVTGDNLGNIFVCNTSVDGQMESTCPLPSESDVEINDRWRRNEAKFAWLGVGFVVVAAWYVIYLVGLAIWKAAR